MRSYSRSSLMGAHAPAQRESAPAGLMRIRPPLEHQDIDSFPGIAPWQLIDALPAAIHVIDSDGRITYFNDAAAALWGYRPKLHTGQWCGSLAAIPVGRHADAA